VAVLLDRGLSLDEVLAMLLPAVRAAGPQTAALAS